jgi:putative endonuclease
MSAKANCKPQDWSVYILRCADDSLYTGISRDVLGRIAKHNHGAGAKYTRGRGPVELVYLELVGSRNAALRREYTIKQLPRSSKFVLIDAYYDLSDWTAE